MLVLWVLVKYLDENIKHIFMEYKLTLNTVDEFQSSIKTKLISSI
jgi:hypothetical protein